MIYDKLYDNITNEAFANLIISETESLKKLHQEAAKETALLFENITFFLRRINTNLENFDNLYADITRYLLYEDYDLKSLEKELFAVIPKDAAPAQD